MKKVLVTNTETGSHHVAIARLARRQGYKLLPGYQFVGQMIDSIRVDNVARTVDEIDA